MRMREPVVEELSASMDRKLRLPPPFPLHLGPTAMEYWFDGFKL